MPPIRRRHKKALLDVIAAASIDVATQYLNRYYYKEPMFLANEAANRGEVLVRQILQARNFRRSLSEFRMPARSFLRLSKRLQEDGKFGDSRNASANQKLAIFLSICAQGLSQRHAAEMYGQPQNQISR